MTYDKIPAELKQLKNWVCYRLQRRDNGDLGKIPVNPKTLQDAKADDPSTWGSFEEATAAAARHPDRVAGIGFEFGNSPYFGIDLDHITDAGGNFLQEALTIVDAVDSYTELSPSGAGLHIICRGSYPDGWKKKKGVIAGQGDIEMYQTGRYFTVTGNVFGALRGVAERSQVASKLQARYNSTPAAKTATAGAYEPAGGHTSDSDLLARMFASQNGAEIRRLWEGDDRGDHSQADLALCNHLAYWTNGDADRMDQLFRQSGLMRDKWDRRESTYGTYGNRTIQTALKDFKPYTGPSYSMADAQRDFEDLDAPASSPVGSQPPADPTEGLVSAADYLRGQFSADREQFKGYKQRKTGFANIDQETGGLYPGLYVLGAQSALGKTTFAHQMADQLARAGDTVLFFSLEQSTFELTTKSLARESYRDFKQQFEQLTAATWQELCRSGLSSAMTNQRYEEYKDSLTRELSPLSSIELRAGKTSPLMRDAYKRYLEYADRVIIKECNFNETADRIADTVKAFIEKTGVTPVVIVDYLQIIPAADRRMGDKEKTDLNMRRLKIMQRDHDLVLFVISALNRANYLTQVSFESFKESGGIEYTADVVWGMQYAVLGQPDSVFSKDPGQKIAQKRQALQKAKAAVPRELELVCLKNRYGRDYTARFNYYPRFDYFELGEFGTDVEEDTGGLDPNDPIFN